MRYQGIPEEKLKNKVAHDWFSKFDTSVITGNIDLSLIHISEPTRPY